MQKLNVHGSQISVGSPESFINKIFESAEVGISQYIYFANVHMVIEAYKDSSFRDLLNNALIVAPDGKPLSIFIWLFYGVKQQRVCGMDFMPLIMKEAERKGKSIYFYGSTKDVLQAIKEKVQIEYPQITIAGSYSPPFRPLTKEEDKNVIEMINNSKADLVFVSLGCPKQEKWMASHKDKVNACMLGVGQAFLTFNGMEKRLPKWMRKLALEWAYRLYQEPGRLWKRYLFTNSIFLFLTAKHVIVKLAQSVIHKIK